MKMKDPLMDKDVRIGVEFEFIIPSISEQDVNDMRTWAEISTAYYEFDTYEEELEKYEEEEIEWPPKLPDYINRLGVGFIDGEDIPDPDEIFIIKPKCNFKGLVLNYLRLSEFPVKNLLITEDSEKKHESKWIIKPDNTVDINGFELVSPILTLQEFYDVCPKILSFINRYGDTTDKCGLHISLSLNNIEKLNDIIDVIKLASFVDEDYIYSLFPMRKGNIYAESVHKELLNYNEDDLNDIKFRYNKDHFMAINIQHLDEKNQYIEFRYIGGYKYHEEWCSILKVVKMYLKALKLSVNKQKKGEYKLKLSKILEG